MLVGQMGQERDAPQGEQHRSDDQSRAGGGAE
jgi:hypothetical protein